jgi:hypothetical protein
MFYMRKKGGFWGEAAALYVTLIVTLVWWLIEPLVAVTLTVYCCRGVEFEVDTVNVDIPALFDSVTLVGESDGVGP